MDIAMRIYKKLKRNRNEGDKDLGLILALTAKYLAAV